jgi:hypothetical protein
MCAIDGTEKRQWTSRVYGLRDSRVLVNLRHPSTTSWMCNFTQRKILLIRRDVLLVLPEQEVLKDYARIFGERAAVVIGWKIAVWWEVRLRCCARCGWWVCAVPCLLLRGEETMWHCVGVGLLPRVEVLSDEG